MGRHQLAGWAGSALLIGQAPSCQLSEPYLANWVGPTSPVVTVIADIICAKNVWVCHNLRFFFHKICLYLHTFFNKIWFYRDLNTFFPNFFPSLCTLFSNICLSRFTPFFSAKLVTIYALFSAKFCCPIAYLRKVFDIFHVCQTLKMLQKMLCVPQNLSLRFMFFFLQN